jgi:hypothetical protein
MFRMTEPGKLPNAPPCMTPARGASLTGFLLVVLLFVPGEPGVMRSTSPEFLVCPVSKNPLWTQDLASGIPHRLGRPP